MLWSVKHSGGVSHKDAAWLLFAVGIKQRGGRWANTGLYDTYTVQIKGRTIQIQFKYRDVQYIYNSNTGMHNKYTVQI